MKRELLLSGRGRPTLPSREQACQNALTQRADFHFCRASADRSPRAARQAVG